MIFRLVLWLPFFAGSLLATLPATGVAQQMRASDFSHCLRTDDGKPVCFHRQTGRITIVPETIYQAVVAAAPPGPSPPGPVQPKGDTRPAETPPVSLGADRPPPVAVPPVPNQQGPRRASEPTLLRTSSREQMCAIVKKWFEVIVREYPNPYQRPYPAHMNLLRDEYFVPFIGSPYLSLYDATIVRALRTVQQCSWNGTDHVGAYRLLEVSDRPRLTAGLQRLSEGSEWRMEALARLSAAPASLPGFEAVNSIELEASNALGNHMPSEKQAFQSSVETRRRVLAETAVQQIAGRSGNPPSIETLSQMQAMIRPAKDAGLIIQAQIENFLQPSVDAAFSQTGTFPATEDGRAQFLAWQRKLEANLAPLSAYSAARAVRPRLITERQNFETRISLAMLESGPPPSLDRLTRIAALRQSSEPSIAERARDAYSRELSALVQARRASMPSFPETAAGLQSLAAWQTQFEKDFQPHRSEDSVRQALAQMGEQTARLTRGSQLAVINDSASASLPRLQVLQGISRAARDAEVSARARAVIERDLLVLVAQRQAEIANLPGTQDGLRRFDSWVEAFKRDFASYNEFRPVEQAISAIAPQRAALAQGAETSDLQSFSQAAPSFEAADGLMRLTASQNSEGAAQARAALESMLGTLLARESASAPSVPAGLDGTATLARWASTLKQRFDRYSAYQAPQRLRETLGERLRTQRDQSIEPFRQSLQAATNVEVFNQAKRTLEQLPRDVVQDLPGDFDRVLSEEFRTWASRSVVQPQTPRPSAGPNAGATAANPLGGLLTTGPRSSAPPTEMRPQPQSYGPALPAPHGEALQRTIRTENPTPMTAESLLFFGGVVSDLLQRCSARSNTQDRSELARLAEAAQNRGVWGGNYSNRNLFEMMEQNEKGAMLFGSGVEFARQLECGSATEALAEQIASASRRQSQGANGGPSPFVQSCAPRYSQEKCECIARFGLSVIPDIHQRPFHRNLIGQIINSSPVVALQMSFRCQVMEY